MRAVWISNRRVMLVYDDLTELFVTDFTGCCFEGPTRDRALTSVSISIPGFCD